MKPEQRTRQEKIDIQLGRAGWSIGSRHLIQEYLVASSSLKDTKTPYKTKNEFADYALMDRHGSVFVAIVETIQPVLPGIEDFSANNVLRLRSFDLAYEPVGPILAQPAQEFPPAKIRFIPWGLNITPGLWTKQKTLNSPIETLSILTIY